MQEPAGVTVTHAVVVVVRVAALWILLEALQAVGWGILVDLESIHLHGYLAPALLAALCWVAAPWIAALVAWRIDGRLDGVDGLLLCVLLLFWIGVGRVISGLGYAFHFEADTWERDEGGLGGVVDLALGAALIASRHSLARWIVPAAERAMPRTSA